MRKCLIRGFNITFASLLFLVMCAHDTSATGRGFFLLAHKNGILQSRDSGKTWIDYSAGLPPKCAPVRIVADSCGRLYCITAHSGVFVRTPPENFWRSINSPHFLFRARHAPPSYYRKISAFAVNPANPDTLALATKHQIYRSFDGGASWQILPMRRHGFSLYITSLAFGPRGEMYAGTSHSGVFRIRNGIFESISCGLPTEQYSANTSFYEEISSIACDPENEKTLFAGLHFGGGIYVSSNGGKTWSPLPHPAAGAGPYPVSGLIPCENRLYVITGAGTFERDAMSGIWHKERYDTAIGKVPPREGPVELYRFDGSGSRSPLTWNLASEENNSTKRSNGNAGGRRALYATAPAAKQRLDGLIATARRCGLNAIVIDMKDDSGNVFFPSSNSVARQIGALKKPFDIRGILARLHNNNIYAIARVVVFKDEKLFNANDNACAIRNRATGKPWIGAPKEYWVDPHSDFVRDYTISLCEELQQLGFDELQFDYIRFPSDGPVHLCQYPCRTDDAVFKSEVLTDFLWQTKKRIFIPLSVDVYGFAAWYRFGDTIGQDIEDFASVIDALCPMVYPSHFGARFYRHYDGNDLPYRLVLDSGLRARTLVGNSVTIRPYLQAFRLFSPTWGPDYIKAQVRAAEDSNASGYTFWNARSDYSMVERAMHDSRSMQ